MRAQPGAGGHPSPHKAAGQLFPLYLVGPGPRVRVGVTRPPRSGSERAPPIGQKRSWPGLHIPRRGRGPGRQLCTAGGGQHGTTSSGGTTGVRGLWSAQGQARLHTREAGVEAGAHGGEGESTDGAGGQVDSTCRCPSQPGSAARGFAGAGVCNQKVQRPFRCASISPCEIQITSFAEKGLIAKGTRQREFCWLFSLKKITVLSLSPQQIEPSRNWAVIPRDASLPSSSL